MNKTLNNIKISAVPPIFMSVETIKYIVEKANIFNEYFASQCTTLENNSKLPLLPMNTNKRLKTVSIKKDDITSTIKSLNQTKSHGFDNISICMIQLCGGSITLLLVQIFKSLLSQGIFPDTWKMVNIVLVHKKETKLLVKNYRPICLLRIFAKAFKRLLFSSLFSHFHNNNLFTKCLSGFMAGDSCISQFLSIVIQSSLDYKPLNDVRAIFLDISKAFDKV